MRFSMKVFCGRVSDLAGFEAMAHFISSDFKFSSAWWLVVGVLRLGPVVVACGSGGGLWLSISEGKNWNFS